MTTPAGNTDKAAWEAREVVGKGLGLFATRNIQVGEIIIEEQTVIVYPQDPFDEWHQKADALIDIYKNLGVNDQAVWGSLYRRRDKTADENYEKYRERLARLPGLRNVTGEAEKLANLFIIADSNAYAMEGNDGLFLKASRLNHSCDPNVHWETRTVKDANNVETGWVTVMAARDVKEGEELNVTYISVFQFPTTKGRRKELKKQWGFECSCPRCMGGPDLYARRLGQAWRALKGINGAEIDADRIRPEKSETGESKSDEREIPESESDETESVQMESGEISSNDDALEETKPDSNEWFPRFIDGVDGTAHTIEQRGKLLQEICEMAAMGSLFNLVDASDFHFLRQKNLKANPNETRKDRLKTALSYIECAQKIENVIWEESEHEMSRPMSNLMENIRSAISTITKNEEKEAAQKVKFDAMTEHTRQALSSGSSEAALAEEHHRSSTMDA